MNERGWAIKFNMAGLPYNRRGGSLFRVMASTAEDSIDKFRAVYPDKDAVKITLVRRA